MKAAHRPSLSFCALGLLTLACAEKIEGPTPAVAGLDPSLVCAEQIVTEVTISGADLSPLAIEAATGDPLLAVPDVALRRIGDLDGGAVTGEAPVLLPNDPADPAAAQVRWTSETSMILIVSEALGLVPGLYEVTVTNRNGRSATLTAALTAVPRPTLTSVEPDLVCVEQGGRPVTLHGAGFVRVGELLPQITLALADGTVVDLPADSVDGCHALPGPTTADTCTEAHVTVPETVLPGAYDVTLTNPAPAACWSTDAVTLAVVPPPHVESIEPDLFCAAAGGTFTITGEGFVRLGDTLPTVRFGDAAEIPAASADGCAPIAGTRPEEEAESCTSLTVEVAPDQVPPGTHAVVVVNPDPPGCESNAVDVLSVAAPTIEAVEPSAVCTESLPDALVVTGQGFLTVGGVQPTVELDGTALAITALDGCTAAWPEVEACTSITVAVTPALLTLGTHALTVTNPPPADCSATAETAVVVASAPTLASVVPFKVCADGGAFVVNGAGFTSGSEILLGQAGTWTPVPTTYVDPTQVEGTIAPLTIAPGDYDVTVSNGEGCEATPLLGALRVVAAPFVFFVDPPVLYSGISLEVTIYASGVTDDVLSVTLRHAVTGDLTPLPDFTFIPAHNRILARVPAGLPAGAYDVLIEDAVCGAELLAGLSVTDELTVDVAGIEPPFAYVATRTPVSVHSTDPTPTGFVGFVATPRVYLSPRTVGGVATELRAASFVSAFRLTGTVPDTLTAPDHYDLVVINPDGAVGVLEDAFRVVDDQPPEITALSPGFVAGTDGVGVTVLGRFFDPDAAVSATCRWSGGSATVEAGETVIDEGTIDTTWNLAADSIPDGAVCVVRVTNVADATWADYSALIVSAPSANISPFEPGNDMTVGRRAAAAAAIRMNSVERFLFAAGGDNGLVGDPAFLQHASVEAAPVDPFGEVGDWAAQRTSLPAGRAFTTAAVAGRFVYLPGGDVADAPTDSVLRGYLLDPFEAPEIGDLDLAVQPAGLDPGIWTYRVAAVLDDTDPNNPLGETLASEPMVVRLPALIDRKIHLTIYWTPVPHAASYRIYRTPTAGLTAADVRLIAEVPATGASPERWTDDATGTPVATAVPLPLGSLGTWHEVGPLLEARRGHAVVAVPNPIAPAETFLYAIGGLGAAGAELATIERATITQAASNDQSISAFAANADGLATGRALAGAVYMDHVRAGVIPVDSAWVYVLTGVSADGGGVNEIDTLEVDPTDGSLVTLDPALYDPVAAPNRGGGYAYAAGNYFLYMFGGGGTPTAGGISAKVCEVGEAGCGGGPRDTPEPPDLVNWNAGISMSWDRYLHAIAYESGFVFLLGGAARDPATGTSYPATTSVEASNL